MNPTVCHITSVHPPDDIRIFRKECVSLANNGYKVILLAAGAKDEVINGVSVCGTEKIGHRLKRILCSSSKMYRQALNCDARIYHFHDPELLRLGAKLVRKGKIVIYDAHEDLPRQIYTKHWIPEKLKKLMAFITEKAENYYAGKMSAIITATPHIEERFRKIHPLVVNINNYPCPGEVNPADWNKKYDETCYIGGILRERGITEMIRATEKSGIRLNLAGNMAPVQMKKELEQEKGWKNVRFYGFVDRQGIVSILDRSRIGLLVLHPLPSYRDSLPIKLFEYMAAGIPVICSNFELWRNIVEKNQCGVCVDPLDVDAIVEAIRFLIDNPARAEAMGTNGRAAVEEKYSWERESEKLRQLYQQLWASRVSS